MSEDDLRIEIIELKWQVKTLKEALQLERSSNETERQFMRGPSLEDVRYFPTPEDLEDPRNAAGSIVIPRSAAVQVLVALHRARNSQDDRPMVTGETIQCAALWIHRLLDALDEKK
jgi:hypothetical protein